MTRFPRHFVIEDDVFHIPIVCVWGVTAKEFAEFTLRKFGLVVDADTLSGDGVFVSATHEGRDIGIVGFPHKFTGTPHEYAMLAHECLHATIEMLGSRGLKLKDASEEAYTYYMDYLIETLAANMLRIEKQLTQKAKKRA
jgi:hypothetical protein